MDESYIRQVKMRAMVMLHIVFTVLIFIVCWDAYYAERFAIEGVTNGWVMVCALYTLILSILCRTYSAFEFSVARVSEMIYSQTIAELVSIGVVYVLFSISWRRMTNPLPLVFVLMMQVMVNVTWSMIAKRVYTKTFPPKKAVIIYRRKSDLARLDGVRFAESKFDIQKYIENPKDDIHALMKEIEGFEVVFVAGVHASLRNGIAKLCIDRDLQGYFIPHVGDVILAGARHERMFSAPVMHVRRAAPAPEYLFAKRLFDIIASLMAIIVTSPIMLIVSLAIKINDRGPVLYKQVRLTKDRREFSILKFRSMRMDAEKDGVARLAAQGDDRITTVGKIIRATRMDELPQLFNILVGDMSIVGPRPERPEIAAQYEKEIPAFSLRLQVKAGLTGYAQVFGRYNTDPYAKLQMDLMYINRMSTFEDFMLIFATVKVLFMRESTEGVAAGQVTAGQATADAAEKRKESA